MEEKDGGVRSGEPRRRRKWPAILVVLAVLAPVIGLLAVSRPEGATYDEYQRLKPGMSRQQVAAIIAMSDYWHHAEGDKDVTSWVNKDGTYIRTVFDKNDVLVEVSWESGWDSSREKQE